MSTPVFKDNFKPATLPSVVYIHSNQSIEASIDKAPYINVSLITKNAEAGASLSIYPTLENPLWQDYWEIYGDSDLLFQGNMKGLLLNSYLTYYYKYITMPATEQWRALYPVYFMNYWMPRWSASGQAITFLQEKTDVSNKLFWEDGTLPQLAGNLPYGQVGITSPPYTKITIKRNIPDAEYIASNTEYINGYMFPTFVQIIDKDSSAKSRFKVIVDGVYYKTCNTELGYTLTMPVSTRVFIPENYTVPGMVDIHGDLIVYWRYKLDTITESSLTKYFYKPIKTQEDYQIMISMDNIKVKQSQTLKTRIK